MPYFVSPQKMPYFVCNLLTVISAYVWYVLSYNITSVESFV
jgi:hypothetical protein